MFRSRRLPPGTLEPLLHVLDYVHAHLNPCVHDKPFLLHVLDIMDMDVATKWPRTAREGLKAGPSIRKMHYSFVFTSILIISIIRNLSFHWQCSCHH